VRESGHGVGGGEEGSSPNGGNLPGVEMEELRKGGGRGVRRPQGDEVKRYLTVLSSSSMTSWMSSRYWRFLSRLEGRVRGGERDRREEKGSLTLFH
jgi:hypothetical protein